MFEGSRQLHGGRIRIYEKLLYGGLAPKEHSTGTADPAGETQGDSCPVIDEPPAWNMI